MKLLMRVGLGQINGNYLTFEKLKKFVYSSFKIKRQKFGFTSKGNEANTFFVTSDSLRIISVDKLMRG